MWGTFFWWPFGTPILTWWSENEGGKERFFLHFTGLSAYARPTTRSDNVLKLHRKWPDWKGRHFEPFSWVQIQALVLPFFTCPPGLFQVSVFQSWGPHWNVKNHSEWGYVQGWKLVKISENSVGLCVDGIISCLPWGRHAEATICQGEGTGLAG